VAGAGDPSERFGRSFKTLFEQCLAEAGLSPRALRQQLLRQTGHDFPETTIDSWRRVHSTTGQLVYPGDAKGQVLAEWLCARPGVTVTEEELLAALRSDKASRATGRKGKDAGGTPLRLARGEVYEGIIDATIYLGMDTVLGRVDHHLRELLNARLPIPTYFAYLTNHGYLNWVRLTQDHRYAYYRASVELCEAKSNQIAQAIVHAAGGGQIDYVGLGPGTGAKDRALVHSLLAATGPDGGSLFYYPYDINPAMIVHAIQTVLGGDLASKVSVKGIIAPFDSLGLFSPVYKDRAGPNVLALLGNTLGNMSDDWGFLETLHSSMWVGDLLLLEVRCHVDEQAGHAPGIGEEAKKRFNFGPLEDLGAVYEEHRDLITIRRERSRSVIPNTVTTVTQCERVTCGDKTWSDVRLAYVHEYSEPDLERVLCDTGFTILERFPGGMRGVDQDRVVLLYLLRRE
jgi:Histidine-specific methyltransferase, SAM-dependent